MALESQGVVIRRESSVAGSTANLSTDTISFDSTQNRINRQAGFADFSTGMRIEVDSSNNKGVWTISATAATYIGVYEPLVAQASGGDVAIEGHAMQEIGQVAGWNGPNITGNIIDITHLRSTAKEKMVGLQDPGDLSISVFFQATSELHKPLADDLQNRTLRRWDIKFTDQGSTAGDQPSAVYFPGYLNGYTITGAVDDVLKGDISISITKGINWIAKT